jgi:peptidoglycan/xylan/chitin deacetylase (PgdA/CDA1 family)
MRRIMRRLRKLFKNDTSPAILMYHRIAELPHDPWGLAVSPKNFADQITALKAFRLPLSMNEFVRRLEDGSLPRNAVAITFDDGYLDNLTRAKPILDQAGIPATIFLTTGQLGSGADFWWDELAHLVLGRRAAVKGHLVLGAETIDVNLPPIEAEPVLPQQWRAWEPPQTARTALYHRSWSVMQALSAAERRAALAAVRHLLSPSSPTTTDRAMTTDEISDLMIGTYIDIGAHSRTHVPLTTLPPDAQRAEISGSKFDCEALLGRRISGFAYPHGDRNAAAMVVVKESGFDWACSTYGAAVNPRRFDRFDLPRLQVFDWNGTEFERQLRSARCDG